MSEIGKTTCPRFGFDVDGNPVQPGVEPAMPPDGVQFNRKRHGGLYDRGRADSYYGRSFSPHWFPLGSYNGPRVLAATPEERAEYAAGYRDNEQEGNFKEWD